MLTFINVRNCIKFYEVAELISASRLKSHCNELISSHWDDFTADDFAHMPASLLYQMFKEKSVYPLHTAIKARREDVVFLYFIEHDASLRDKLNEWDDRGDLPLDLALRTRQESIANSLLKQRGLVDINKTDQDGLSLLHRAVKRDDYYAAMFLVENGISVNLQSNREDNRRTALMYLAAARESSEEAIKLVEKILLVREVNVNVQDLDGNTALHASILAHNKPVFKQILFNSTCRVNLNLINKSEQTVLWLALQQSEQENDFDADDSFPSLLIQRGCEINTIDSNGDSLLHLCARKALERAALFLVNRQAKVNMLNGQFESVLHIACENGLVNLVEKLLVERDDADPNVQTSKLTFAQTPMHKAIINSHEDIVDLFIKGLN